MNWLRAVTGNRKYQIWWVVLGLVVCLGPIPALEKVAIVHTNLLTMCSIVLLLGVPPLMLLNGWRRRGLKETSQEAGPEQPITDKAQNGKESGTTKVSWRMATLIGLVEIGAFSYLYMWSITMGNAGKASVLVTSTTLWSGWLGWWLLKERANRVGLAGMALVAIGLVLVLVIPNDPNQSLRVGVIASGCGLLAGLAQSVGALLTRKIQQENQVDLIDLVAKAVAVGAVGVTVLTVLTGHWVWPTGWLTWGLLAIAGVLGTAGGWAIVTWLFVNLPNYLAALLLLFVPVSCSLFAIAVGSSLTALGWIGLAILIVGAGCGGLATRLALTSEEKAGSAKGAGLAEMNG